MLCDRILEAGGRLVVWGRYTYRLDPYTGIIRRCLTDDIGKKWVDSEGNWFDGWGVWRRV